jgi:hypothetical protein
MRERVLMVLAGAAVAGSLLVSGAQARGGGGHGGGGDMVRMGIRGGVRMEGFGRGRMAGIATRSCCGFGRACIGADRSTQRLRGRICIRART